jgi:hypothetical protein
MYLGMDGTGAPMRTQQVIGRAGKQTDGSSKTREAKLVTVWPAESRDDRGKPMRDPGSVSYSAAIESAATPDASSQLSDFAERVSREANRRGFNEAPRPSGARRWRCHRIQPRSYSPPAIQILDQFHAKEHISDIGKLLFPDGIERKTSLISKSALSPCFSRVDVSESRRLCRLLLMALVRNGRWDDLGEIRRAAAVVDVQYELALQGSRPTNRCRSVERRALTSDKQSPYRDRASSTRPTRFHLSGSWSAG